MVTHDDDGECYIGNNGMGEKARYSGEVSTTGHKRRNRAVLLLTVRLVLDGDVLSGQLFEAGADSVRD